MSLFNRHDLVKHVASGGEYIVLLTPEDGMVWEKTLEPLYAYQSTKDCSGLIFNRAQSEMEDGRFVLLGRTFSEGTRRTKTGVLLTDN